MSSKKVLEDICLAGKQLREFGVPYAVKYLAYKYTHKTQKYIDNASQVLRSYVDKPKNEFAEVQHNAEMPSVVPVWIFWWQGYDNMPELVKACLNSVKKNLPKGTSLVLITKDNYMEYALIPDEIMTKVHSGVYSITLFSDLLRNQLLVSYGGLWIDATMYCARPISYDFLHKNDFWSIKLRPDPTDRYSVGRTVTNRMWGGFIQKTPPNSIINSIVLSALKAYMLEHNVLAEYFIQNIFIRLLYDSNADIKKMIDKIPLSNPCLYDLAGVINRKYSEDHWLKLTEDTTFFKLSWKKKYQDMDSNGENTFYGYLIN